MMPPASESVDAFFCPSGGGEVETVLLVMQASILVYVKETKEMLRTEDDREAAARKIQVPNPVLASQCQP